MTAREDVIDAVRESDARLQALAPRLRARPQAGLPGADWVVRDALCHLAARADCVGVVQTLLPSAAQATAAAPVDLDRLDIDSVNRVQIAERGGRSVDDLLEEIAAGHAAAMTALAALGDDVLQRRVTLPGPLGVVALVDLLLLAGPRHEQAHLDDVERALADEAAGNRRGG
jgi:hypothetical protein